jgi:hypothetical protein
MGCNAMHCNATLLYEDYSRKVSAVVKAPCLFRTHNLHYLVGWDFLTISNGCFGLSSARHHCLLSGNSISNYIEGEAAKAIVASDGFCLIKSGLIQVKLVSAVLNFDLLELNSFDYL